MPLSADWEEKKKQLPLLRFCTRDAPHCPALQCAAQTRISNQGSRARATHRAASATPPPDAGSGVSSDLFRAHGEGLDPHMWRMTYLPRYTSMYVNDNQDTACWSTCLQMNRWAQHRASPDRSARRQSVCPTPNMRPDPPCNGARTTSNEREKTLNKLHTSIQRNRRKQRDWCHTHHYLHRHTSKPLICYTPYTNIPEIRNQNAATLHLRYLATQRPTSPQIASWPRPQQLRTVQLITQPRDERKTRSARRVLSAWQRANNPDP